MTYLLQPTAPYPLYQPVCGFPQPLQFPVSWPVPQYLPQPPLSVQLATPPQKQEEVDERWLQRRRETEREVGEEIVRSVVPDLVREIVNDTISDIIFSYVGHQSPRRNISKPHLPTLSRPITPLLPLLPCRPCTQHSDLHLRGNEVVIGRPEKRLSSPHPLLHLIKQNLTDTELSRDVASLLMEEMTFQLLLTSDLDDGVSMATRTQAKHMLIDMIFNELLMKLIMTNSTH